MGGCASQLKLRHCPTSLSGVPFSSLQSHGIVRVSGAVSAADGADRRRHQTESNEGLTPLTFFARTWELDQQSLLDNNCAQRDPLHEVQIRQATNKYYFFSHPQKLLTTKCQCIEYDRGVVTPLSWQESYTPELHYWQCSDLNAWDSWMPLKSVTTLPFGLCGCSQTCTSGTVSQTVGAAFCCWRGSAAS